MHTLLARDASAAHLNSQLPQLLLHYDSCSGEVSFVSTDPSSRPLHQRLPSEMRDDAASPPPTIRRHANPQQPGRRPSMEVGISKQQSPKRQSSKFGTMMRKLMPKKTERTHASLPNEVFAPPPPANYPGGLRPARKSIGTRPESDIASNELAQSPLAAHPMAIADSEDAVARITKFVNQKRDLPRGSSLPNFIFSTPMAGETWYDNGNVSLGSEQGEQQHISHGSSARSLASSRHRSRSVSALSDSTRPSERQVLRKQKSAKSLRRSLSRKRNTSPETPDVPMIPAYPSGFSEDQSEAVVSELPADVPEMPAIPQPLPALLPVPRPKTSGHDPNEPRQTFDFSSLATAMRSQDEMSLQTHEERLTAMEVKMMSLEYAISKVQGRLPTDEPVSFRKPSTDSAAAVETAYNPSTSAVARDEPRPSSNNPFRSQSASSSTSTVRPPRPSIPPRPTRAPPAPAPNSHPGETQVIVEVENPPGSPRRTSINLLTVDHYSKLVSLLRHEQAARKQLAEEVSSLQAEITALRPLAHSPLGSSYRSWRDAQSQTIEKGWAVVEEFRAGKRVGRQHSREGRDADIEDSEDGGTKWEGARPTSSATSEASSESSFGNAFETPVGRDARDEQNLFLAGIPAGQAF